MNEKTVSICANSNWLASGCDLDHAIQTRITHEDIYIRPELDEILSEKYAVLLTRANLEDRTACELQITVCPRYKIASLTFVCSTAKIELFFGPLREYVETVYGALISDDNDEPLSYRYDIEIEKSGVVELTVKMPTAVSEICFFGILLQIAPNPNGITTMLPGTVNFENVQQILDNSGQKLSAGAEKCRMFVEMLNHHGGASKQAAEKPPSSLLEEMRQMLQNKSHSSEPDAASSLQPMTLDNIIKTHIDAKISDLAETIHKRLDELEKKQSEKLDKILNILEKMNC